ncbi:DUF2694 domain-containing protein [Mycolicibacterium mucogenicum]|uniref:hypothetical protein n=1 Tax=Mycolicibacterium mucogenicum TaxID=56689 RepID=UPI0006B387F0|nr:hypothetical protein [Mycolicibacterium mucogenicum]MCX8565113.1 DUF2694 domain-containing protein [Mycolicibacterium mucogenicum]
MSVEVSGQEVFEATSKDKSIIVTVDLDGATLGVQLEPEAMELADFELSNRIQRLNTLAFLRSQLAIRLKWEAANKMVRSPLPTEKQVQRYAATIDF